MLLLKMGVQDPVVEEVGVEDPDIGESTSGGQTHCDADWLFPSQAAEGAEEATITVTNLSTPNDNDDKEMNEDNSNHPMSTGGSSVSEEEELEPSEMPILPSFEQDMDSHKFRPLSTCCANCMCQVHIAQGVNLDEYPYYKVVLKKGSPI